MFHRTHVTKVNNIFFLTKFFTFTRTQLNPTKKASKVFI